MHGVGLGFKVQRFKCSGDGPEMAGGGLSSGSVGRIRDANIQRPQHHKVTC